MNIDLVNRFQISIRGISIASRNEAQGNRPHRARRLVTGEDRRRQEQRQLPCCRHSRSTVGREFQVSC